MSYNILVNLFIMNKIDLDIAAIVAQNLKTLMTHYNLTVYGVEIGTGLEVHTINKILKKRTNLSTTSAKKIAAFFDITVDVLFSGKPLKLRKIENTPTIKKFYEDYPLNNKYYITRHKENAVGQFLRKVMIGDPNFEKGQRAGKIADYIEQKYAKGFKTETVRKELERMYAEGFLEREDRSGAGAVFFYKVKK